MWIQCENEAVRSLYVKTEMDEAVEFNENGTAQVTKEVGELLIDYYDSVGPASPEDGDDEDAVTSAVDAVDDEESEE